jgi:hypothetical protein
MITESHDAAPYDPSMSQRPSDVYCSINICHAALTAQPYPSWPMSKLTILWSQKHVVNGTHDIHQLSFDVQEKIS